MLPIIFFSGSCGSVDYDAVDFDMAVKLVLCGVNLIGVE